MMGNSYGGDDLYRLCWALRVMDTYLSTQTLTSQPVILPNHPHPWFLPFFFFALLCFLSSFSTCFLIECPGVGKMEKIMRHQADRGWAKVPPSGWIPLFLPYHPGHISISASPHFSHLSVSGIWSVKSFLGRLICSQLGLTNVLLSSHSHLLFSSIQHNEKLKVKK